MPMLDTSRLFTNMSRCRMRARSRPTPITFACSASLILTFLLSIQKLDQSCAWTATTRPLLWAPIDCRSTLPKERKRCYPSTTTCLHESPVATPIDESTSESTDISKEAEITPKDVPIEDLSAWEILAGNVLTCLIASDMKRATGMDGGSTGWTSWIEESSSFKLQQCVDRLAFGCEEPNANTTSIEASSSRDETLRWMKWMKATPSSMVVELSSEFRSAVQGLLTEGDLERAGIVDAQSRTDFLSRIGCRLILLPSGRSLQTNIQTPPGAMVYGKLLYGGVTRYRLIGGGGKRPPRKAGERTTIMPLREESGDSLPRSKGWLQYGGPDRNYNAIDMGPCGLMEVTILPKDLKLGLLSARRKHTGKHKSRRNNRSRGNNN